MAQHFSIQNSGLKSFREIYKSIYNSFGKGLPTVRSSLKYQEIYDKNFKETESDLVFETWRSINGERETFEIHFDTQRNEITNIFLVK